MKEIQTKKLQTEELIIGMTNIMESLDNINKRLDKMEERIEEIYYAPGGLAEQEQKIKFEDHTKNFNK